MSKKNKVAAATRQDDEATNVPDETKAAQSSPTKMALLVFGLPFVLLLLMALMMRQS